MALNMADAKIKNNSQDKSKLSARMSIFSWVICALLGWAFAITSFSKLTSNSTKEMELTAEKSPSIEEATKMENIRPAAGRN